MQADGSFIPLHWMEKEEIGGAEVFSPGEWMFCEDRPDYKDWSEDRARL